MTNRTTRLDSGLTLLEVLAAAMIFAMVMTVLIGTSSTAVHSVGQSARRLEANMLADAVLADLEIAMKEGYAPDVAELDIPHDQFSVQATRIDVLGGADGQPAGALAALAGSSGDITSILASGLPEVGTYLRQYDIEVSWVERDGTQSVKRTTFAYDWDLAALEMSDLFASGAAAADARLLGGDGTNTDANGNERPDGFRGAQGQDGPRPGATEAEKAFYQETNRLRRIDGRNARNDIRLRALEREQGIRSNPDDVRRRAFENRDR